MNENKFSILSQCNLSTFSRSFMLNTKFNSSKVTLTVPCNGKEIYCTYSEALMSSHYFDRFSQLFKQLIHI